MACTFLSFDSISDSGYNYFKFYTKGRWENMSYLEITRTDKQNISFPCVPFCIEKNRLNSPDSVHVHNYHHLTVVTQGRDNLVVNNFSCKVNA